MPFSCCKSFSSSLNTKYYLIVFAVIQRKRFLVGMHLIYIFQTNQKPSVSHIGATKTYFYALFDLMAHSLSRKLSHENGTYQRNSTKIVQRCWKKWYIDISQRCSGLFTHSSNKSSNYMERTWYDVGMALPELFWLLSCVRLSMHLTFLSSGPSWWCTSLFCLC